MKVFGQFEKIIKLSVDIMIGILVLAVSIAMGEGVFKITQHVLMINLKGDPNYVIEQMTTIFIFLEIILMLLRYIKEGHHIPVRYLVLISMTAILRELLLEHGGGIETVYLSIAILILVAVLFMFEKMTSFTSIHSEKDEKI
ncbi:phosphate-starvation-inducible PsiE family protein [Enterococcus eurekensis]|uniref:Protein PsiE n=2 Tax=Enterococcus TaxID=1350 RepID=A0ABV9M1M0_9ENTE|nr:phosphate-starvation-inducible PsiE family protein [Candidatus Enterococcus avicola]